MSFSGQSFQSAYAATPVGMPALPAHAENVFLTAIISILRKKRMSIRLKKRCSTLSVLFTFRADAPTAANAAEFVRREFPFICSTESLLRTSMIFTANIKPVKLPTQEVRLFRLKRMIPSLTIIKGGHN